MLKGKRKVVKHQAHYHRETLKLQFCFSLEVISRNIGEKEKHVFLKRAALNQFSKNCLCR